MKKLRLNKVKVANLSNQELLKVKGGNSDGECSGVCNSDMVGDPLCGTSVGGPINLLMIR